MPDDDEPLTFEQEVAIHITAGLMAEGLFVPVYTDVPKVK
jgi:hypothetical protein